VETVLGGIFPSLVPSDMFSYFSIMQHISLYSMLFIFIVGVVLGLRYLFTKKSEIIVDQTWGCGYIAPTPKIQYTGKSFSKSLGKLFQFVLFEKKTYNELKTSEIFPQNRKYSSYYLDFFEHRLINPIINYQQNFIDLFKFIQNGKVQAYVLYGILFILIVFVGTIFNIWY
jgi:hypothetical protein